MPGWDRESWGYHGDDGESFGLRDCNKRWKSLRVLSHLPYGPTYGAGDVVGCGIDFATQTAFFTKNGTHLGEFEPDVLEIPVTQYYCRYGIHWYQGTLFPYGRYGGRGAHQSKLW